MAGPRVSEAKAEYNRDAEQAFRRELEVALSELFDGILTVTSGSNGSVSLYSKRESFTIPPVGVVKY